MSDGDRGKDDSRQKETTHGWRTFLLAALPALVSIGAALLSASSASRASKQANLLERYKIEREGQFKVYERVEGQLAHGQPYNLVIASAYVQLIEDVEIRRALCETIGSIAFSQLASNSATSDKDRIEAALRDVVRVARDCSEAMAVGRSAGEANLETTPGVSPTNATAVQERASQQAPVTEVLSNAQASPTGWDVDVFWCESQGDRSRQLAAQAAAQLAEIANANRQVGGQALGRVRLRSVSAQVRARLMPVPGNRVFGSADEKPFAEALVGELNGRISGSNFRYSRANAVTRWYVSIFACGFEK